MNAPARIKKSEARFDLEKEALGNGTAPRRTAPANPRRRFAPPHRWHWALGGLALVTVAAGWVMNPFADQPAVIPTASGGLPGIVCYGYVDVEQGVSELSPAQPGRVKEVLVREGDRVEAGAVLLRLDDQLARLRLEEARAALKAARIQLEQARKLPEQFESKRKQQQAAVEAIGHQVSAARQVLTRRQRLAEAQHLPPEEIAAAREQVKQLEAGERAEQEKLAEMRLHDPKQDVERAEAELAVVSVRVEQAQHALDECSLKAPQAGSVVRLHVSAGDLVGKPGQPPALQFCPDGRRLVRAEVDQEFAARVRVGQLAGVEDDVAGAAGAWRGKVVRLSDWYTQRRVIVQEPFQRNDVRTLECLIALEPDQPPLRLGQRMRVRIGE